jgi:methylated-DNA-[protein]-cysteine S-methyltransferase
MKEKCYELLRQIPKGKVTTYKHIADQLGTKSYRLIGQIVGANLDIPATPCHRVVKASGDISGYALGVDKKIALLKSEGVEVEDGKVKNFHQIIHKFK